jgi:hypothetical protein
MLVALRMKDARATSCMPWQIKRVACVIWLDTFLFGPGHFLIELKLCLQYTFYLDNARLKDLPVPSN